MPRVSRIISDETLDKLKELKTKIYNKEQRDAGLVPVKVKVNDNGRTRNKTKWVKDGKREQSS